MGIDPTAFIHPAAFVCGRVTLGPRASVWPTAVLRADSDAIVVGASTNIQDGTVIHVDPGLPVSIGDRVAIGHRAVIHGATVGDDCLIGIGAIVLNRVVVGRGCIIGAGALCPEGMQVPEDSIVLGVPGRVVRKVRQEERERIAATVAAYLVLQERHRQGEFTIYMPDESGSS